MAIKQAQYLKQRDVPLNNCTVRESLVFKSKYMNLSLDWSWTCLGLQRFNKFAVLSAVLDLGKVVFLCTFFSLFGHFKILNQGVLCPSYMSLHSEVNLSKIMTCAWSNNNLKDILYSYGSYIERCRKLGKHNDNGEYKQLVKNINPKL